MNSSAIYQIYNKVTNKFYIGSAINLSTRWSTHVRRLDANTHVNKHLQAAWNKYDRENFECRILEIVDDVGKLIEREQYWLDRTKCYDQEIGYNLCPTANSMLGFSSPLKGKKLSIERRKQLSEAQKGRIITEHQKKAVSEANKNRIGAKYNVAGCPTSRCKCDDCREHKRKLKREARLRMKLVNPEKVKENDRKWKTSRKVLFTMLP